MHLTKAFALLFALATVGSARADDAVDLNRIDRRSGKEPSYTADQPLYGLVVVGPEAKTRVWMVLDKSAADAGQYDVLYADLNGNGDLTEPAERVVGTAGQFGDTEFRLPDLTDAGGDTHTEFKLSVRDRNGPAHMVSLRWRGKSKIGGGYPADPEAGYTQFAATRADAPILWLNGDGPYRFQRWYSAELPIGGAGDLKLFVGLPGVGKSTFCAFQEHVLPADEGVQATLVYTDGQGKEQRATYDLMDRC